MNKAELVTAVSEKTGDPKKDVDEVVSAVFESIIKSLGAGEKVQIIGYGTFAVRERQGRQGRNPATGEAI